VQTVSPPQDDFSRRYGPGRPRDLRRDGARPSQTNRTYLYPASSRIRGCSAGPSVSGTSKDALDSLQPSGGTTMNRWLLAVFLFTSPVWGEESAVQPLTLTAQDRILILSPHPDDDILGCAGVIQTAVKTHLPLRVVYLTNGDNYEWAFLRNKK